MERREFIAWAGLGLVASSLPLAIAACAAENQNTSAVKPESQSQLAEGSSAPAGLIAVGTVAQLDEKKVIEVKDNVPNPILVLRDPTQADQLIAINPRCTHQGCTVDWQAEQGLFVCPCHNSQFSPKGQVSHGPANQPLQTYRAKIEGNTVLVNFADSSQ